MFDDAGSTEKLVRIRVTELGHGVVSDARWTKSEQMLFGEGDEFECPFREADLFVQASFATFVDPPEIDEESPPVAMRVTEDGHGMIHYGFGQRYGEGQEFTCSPEDAEKYESRGFAERIGPEIPATVPHPKNRESDFSTAPQGGGDALAPPQDFENSTDSLRARRRERDWVPFPRAEARAGNDIFVSGGGTIDREAIARLAARARREEQTGCLVWQGSKAHGGYGQITYRRTNYRTHRLMWSAHHGPVPPGKYVCHACDKPACIAIEHLFLGSPRENFEDMRRKKRLRYNAKLSFEEVSEIRRRFAAGEKAVTIAKDFAVGYEQILAIKNGRAWVQRTEYGDRESDRSD